MGIGVSELGTSIDIQYLQYTTTEQTLSADAENRVGITASKWTLSRSSMNFQD